MAGLGAVEMKSIGKYQVVEQLGTSAAGTAYKVRDSFRNREFALKLLQSVPGLTAAAKEKFCASLAACADLSHRHIVKVQDLGEVEEGLFIVSELRTGIDLRRFMDENRELPLVQKLALVAQVAEGLAFAHSREIAHGNLKPSNVFVDAARDITLLDFGIAKWLGAMLEAGSRPENLAVNYLAPEQILGKPFDARSDIFALGLMLYEFASGKYPFSAAPGLIPREIVHTEAEPLRKLDPQIPVELEQLVQRALHKDPEQRLQNAEEFAAGMYLAAQELRRRATAEAPTEVAPAPRPIVDMPVVEVASPAAAAPATSDPHPAPEPAADMDPTVILTRAALAEIPHQESAKAPEPPVRERPQDQTGPPQPWTARSYSAGVPLARETAFGPTASSPSAPPPQQPPPPIPAAAIPAVATNVLAAPAAEAPLPQPLVPPPPPQYVAPQPARREPAAPGVRSLPKGKGKGSKRMVAVIVGLVLALVIIGSFVSRQRLKASQNNAVATQPAHAAASSSAAGAVPAPAPAPPPSSTDAAPREPAAKSGDSGPDDIGNPEFSARQTLHGPVRSMWESGRYGEAMSLVNLVLTSDPNNAEARAWKKKIHDAQQAEAALK
jgi:serine/threonine-protein kinase